MNVRIESTEVSHVTVKCEKSVTCDTLSPQRLVMQSRYIHKPIIMSRSLVGTIAPDQSGGVSAGIQVDTTGAGCGD